MLTRIYSRPNKHVKFFWPLCAGCGIKPVPSALGECGVHHWITRGALNFLACLEEHWGRMETVSG